MRTPALQDAFNNPIDATEVACELRFVAVGQAGQPNVSWACVPNVNGTALDAAVFSTEAGVYSVSAMLQDDGNDVFALSGGVLHVSAAEPSANHTRIPRLQEVDNATVLTAGVAPPLFTFQASDEFGNVAHVNCTGYTVRNPYTCCCRLSSTGSQGQRGGHTHPPLQAALLGPGMNVTVPVSPSDGGVCGLAFGGTDVLREMGQWQVHVYLGETQIQGSPFQLSVLPAPIDPSASYALSKTGQKILPCSQPTACAAYFEVGRH